MWTSRARRRPLPITVRVQRGGLRVVLSGLLRSGAGVPGYREDRHEVGLHGARWAGFIGWGHRRPEAGGGPLNTRSTGCASSFGLFDTKVNM